MVLPLATLDPQTKHSHNKAAALNEELKWCLTLATLRQNAFLTKLQGQSAVVVSALGMLLNT